MPIRIASRLFRNRHGTFYFRLLIPNDLRACVGRREMRFSLGTEERYWAVKRPEYRGGSNTGEWSHEEVPEVFA